MALLMIKGKCKLGVFGSHEACFEEDDNGECIYMCKYDMETKSIIQDGHIFGDWQAYEYLKEVLKELNPNRNINIPDFKSIIQRANNDNVDVCDYCKDFNCMDCIVRAWKEGKEDDAEKERRI